MAGLVTTVGGNDISAYIPARSIYAENVAMHKFGTARFDVQDATGTVSIATGDVVTIVDDGTTLWGGVVSRLKKGQSGLTKTWKVTCQDYNSFLRMAIPTHAFAAATADDSMIDTLFSAYRSDVDSVTEVAQLDASMEAVTFTAMTLREVMDDICRRTGGRYYIDFDKNLHYFATESNNASFSLHTTPDMSASFPFENFQLVEDGTRKITHVWTEGKEVNGWHPGTPDYSADERHAVDRDARITTAQGVTDRGTAIYNRYSAALTTYEMDIHKDGLVAGESITLVNEIWSIDAAFYVRKVEMYVEGKDGELRRYHITLDDEPFDPVHSQRHTEYEIAIIENQVWEIDTLASRGWAHDLVFSATDNDTVAWAGGGTITLAGGTGSFSIDAGNTGNMAAVTYVYLDADTSVTVLQTDTDAANAVGRNKILIAVCNNVAATKDATFEVFGGPGHTGLIVGNEVVANSIDTGHLVAGAVETDILNALAVTTPKINDLAVTGSKMTIGGGFFDSHGDLLLNPGCPLAPTSWTSLKGQQATIANAFQTMRGAFPGTQGIVMEPGTTNLVTNPSFGIDTTDWATDGTNTIARSSDQSKFDGYSLKCTYQDDVDLAYHAVTLTAALHYASAWIYVPDNWDGGDIHIAFVNFGGSSGVVYDKLWTSGDPVNRWLRVWCHDTPVGGDLAGHMTIRTTSGPTAGRFIYVDGVQAEPARLSTAAIGSMAWCAWSGDAHDSTSTRTGTTLVIPTAGNITAATGSIVIWFKSLRMYNPSGGMLFSAGNANGEFDAYVTSAGGISYRLNAAERCASGAIGADQDHCAVFTWNVSGDASELFLDGVSVDTGTCGGGAFTLGTNIEIGYSSHVGVAYNLCGVVTEYATFDDLLTADEVAEIWNLQRAMDDQVATDTPGIYIIDGKFQLSSAYTGTRIELTADEIAGYNGATKQFYLSATDGKAYAAGGNFKVDVSGPSVTLPAAVSDTRAYRFVDSDGAVQSRMQAYYTADNNALQLHAGDTTVETRLASVSLIAQTKATSANYGIISLAAWRGATVTMLQVVRSATLDHIETTAGSDMRVGGGLYVGAIDVAPTDNCVTIDGWLKAGGTGNYWTFEDATVAGDFAGDRRVHITIDGNDYTLVAATGHI